MPISNGPSFLKSLTIFQGLEDDELDQIAEIAEEYKFQKDTILFHQRDLANKLIIVRTGRLYAYRLDRFGVTRWSQSFIRNNYFYDLWLFTPGTYPMTVRGAEAGRLIFIEQKRFLDLLGKNPGLLDRLYLSGEGREAAEGSAHGKPGRRFKSLKLLPDEVVKYQKRRSIWVLVSNIALPLIIGFIVIALMGYFLGVSSTASKVLILLVVLIVGAVVVWRAMDWANDYFVITNRHLVHQEFSLRRFQANLNKTPIDQVQSVEVLKPNLFASLLNVGTARMTTSAQSAGTMFSYIDDPGEVEEIINTIRQQVHSMNEGRTQVDIRTAFDRRFEVNPVLTKVDQSEVDEELDDTGGILGAILGLASGIFQRARQGIRTKVVSPDGTITYRKHPVTMIGRVKWPVFVGILLILLIIVLNDRSAGLVLSGLLFLDFLWFIWLFEDWRNETFMLTDRLVVDIDRKPFFFGVSRKQAELRNVQNVSAEKPTFLATMFNFGDVKIETAGASANIVFESVARPNRVQRDVFGRRNAFMAKQGVAEVERRRQEYAILADVIEQEHFPRRT